jgi:uncharacterized repeat protein (TIGR01451 family)
MLALRGTSRAAGRTRSRVIGAVTVLAVLFGVALAGPASAAPVSEITGRWAPGTPTTVAKGSVVTAEWRVNVNDDAAAPSNDPVDNVDFAVTLEHGRFRQLPDPCLTTGVTPPSSISPDGTTLVCNLGTQKQGTAAVVQTAVLTDGATGDELGATGTVDGKTADLPKIPIVNPFAMDIAWGTPTRIVEPQAGYVNMDFEWTLNLAAGSENGPNSVSYTLNVSAVNGSTIAVGPTPCAAFTRGAAAGHPWSGGSHPANQLAPFVGGCTLAQTGPNTFTLTLTGIDYTQAQVPTKDSAGGALPADEVAVASGSVWFRVNTTTSTGVDLSSNAPTYTSTTGQTAPDDPANNAESKTWTTPGLYSSGWGRSYTGNGGTTWDATYRVAAGTTVGQYMDTAMQLHTDRPDDRLVGMCAALDTKYVTFDHLQNPAGGINNAVVEYYTGNDAHLDPTSGSYDPNGFDCGVSGGWSTTSPADPSQVRAVRVTITQGQIEAYSDRPNITPVVFQTIKPNTPPGTDVWSFFSGVVDSPLNNWWNGTGCILNTPGLRYPCTTGFRDLVRVVTAAPAVSKSVDRSVVKPGVPATYTLSYSANGTGAPATVDNYQLVDTLPGGVTYVPGSATPAPVVSTNGSGRQVLTWTLNGVPTNAVQALTYQAVADSTVTPGQTLTNSVTASYGGTTTAPTTAQVTVSTAGFTEIGKTADAAYIPNTGGDGVGSGSWTVTLRSFDPLPQAFTDTIDILPYRGDGRGTSYSGSYALDEVTAPAGATVYYTTANPASLSDDPAHASNGSAGSTTGNTVGWTTTKPADPTAVRVIGGTLAPGAVQQFTVAVSTDGAEGGDKLVNRAQARDEHTGLVMRTSAPITVANYYSASLKKYVQDATGAWRDANTAADYPTFRYGDTVKYRIVITNTGQGTLTDIDVTDDKNPSAGAFHLASLAPGAEQTHEYSMVLDTSVAGTVVNTACGAAATPSDSQVAPDINCDAAGFEVANYTTVKTADPAAGTAVAPGQVVKYTITVTQQGSAPAPAEFSDDLAGVLDDATYNDDAQASLGDVDLDQGVLSWTGTVPVGGVATITYSVTVKDVEGLEAGGDADLVNPVTSPGCKVTGGKTVNCGTSNPVGYYRYAKAADPKSGSTVRAGDTVEYTVTVTQRGKGEVTGATVTDDLSKVLDDATYNRDATQSSGSSHYAAPELTWRGDLAVGQKATLTYSVTVTGEGDRKLHNVVTTPDQRAVCDETIGCETDHAVTSAAGVGGERDDLAVTGTGVKLPLILGSLLLGSGALLLLAGIRRRRTTS